jgi:hypothetical protein
MASADTPESITDRSPFHNQTRQDGNGAVTVAAARTLDGIGNRRSATTGLKALRQR